MPEDSRLALVLGAWSDVLHLATSSKSLHGCTTQAMQLADFSKAPDSINWHGMQTHTSRQTRWMGMHKGCGIP